MQDPKQTQFSILNNNNEYYRKMKKNLSCIIAFLTLTTVANADGLVVADVGIQPGKTATVQVALNSTGETYRAILFTLSLPEGVSIVTDEFGEPVTLADTHLATAGYNVTANHLDDGSNRFAVMNTSGNVVIPTKCGPLFSFTIEANSALVSGTVLAGILSDIKLTDAYAVDHHIDNMTFQITIEETRTILNESSTTAPMGSDGAVNVRVKRTIKANEWSTICLPFAMSADQITEAFGNNVTWELASFNGYTITEDNDDNIIGITVKFNSATSIAANTPCLIKVSDNVTEFTVDGVEIAPIEEPKVTKGRGKMYGNYVAGTELDYGCLFLSGNQFWYSIGDTKIKAFRGYFDFRDYLTEFEENYSSRIVMSFDDATGITNTNSTNDTNEWYTVSGVKVEKPVRKGLYINNGHKVVVK